MSRTTVQATSAATSRLRVRWLSLVLAMRFGFACMADCGSTRMERSAGRAPKSRAVRIDRPAAASRTGQLTWVSLSRGRLDGAAAMRSRTPVNDSRMPNAPPATARTMLSISVERTSRSRLAPSAARTAISRSRATARASCRFARLTQPMRSTAPTAASRSHRALLTAPATSCLSDSTMIPA